MRDRYGIEMCTAPYSKVELRLQQLVGMALDKCDWVTKVLDAAIYAKWRKEMLVLSAEWYSEEEREFGEDWEELPASRINGLVDLALQAVKLCSQRALQEQGAPLPAAVSGCFSLDNAIPPHRHHALLETFATLAANEPKDWHPGSDGLVLDLVHPSLYCLHRPHVDQRNSSFSPAGLYWLPTEFRVSADGTSCDILSPINNLCRVTYPQAYEAIGDAFCRVTPLLETVLGAMQAGHPLNERLPVRMHPYYSDDMKVPPALPRHAPELYPKFARFSLRERSLQVIVKLASIELTPDKPRYGGGSWHIEGLPEEAIIASAIYYLSNDNVAVPSLEFRTKIGDVGYYQDRHEDIENIYGIELHVNERGNTDAGPLNQHLGACTTCTGRALAWPNALQHRLRPFELVDKSLPGRRQMLVFFLVDPLRRVPSTLDVPPQQLHIRRMEVLKASPRFECLPRDIFDKILLLSGCLTREEAEQRRDELMKERSFMNEEVNREEFERMQYNLCEH